MRLRFIGALCCAALAATGATPHNPASTQKLAALEARIGGRIGLYAIDTGTGAVLLRHADERFAFCSSFKWLLAADVLERALQAVRGRAQISVEQRVPYTKAELVGHSPVTRDHLNEGAMSVGALCDAVIEASDNGAANLLLPLVGGPTGVTAWLRGKGDATTRLDRIEPALNTNLAGDPRDTSTPAAMAATMRRLLVGDDLPPEARDRVLRAMERSETGAQRLRAGIPKDWRAADKTGTCGERGAVNDLAVLWPPGRKPIVVASFLSDSASDLAVLEGAQRELGAIIAAEFAAP